MKKFKLLSLSGLTIAGIHFFNKYISEKALVQNNSFTDFEYKWSYGVIRYSKQGSGTPVLLIHDLTAGSSSYEWKFIASSLEKKHTVYTLDLLGCGNSDKPVFTYTNFLFVQLLKDFVADVINDSCDLVTSGTSCEIALMYALTPNCSVKKIITVNPYFASNEELLISKKNKYCNYFYQLPMLGTFAANLKNSREAFEQLFYNNYYHDGYAISSDCIDAYYSAYHTNGTSRGLFSSILNHYTHTDTSGALNRLTIPLSVIAGAYEPDIDTAINAYKTADTFTGADFIPDTRHLPHLEKPDEFVKVLMPLLS